MDKNSSERNDACETAGQPRAASSDIVRVAAVDIGTVTCRLMIADVSASGVSVVERQTEIVNLGEGVDATGRLSEAAMDRTLAVLARYKGLMDRCTVNRPIDQVTVMATSATRDAQNSRVFEERLAQLGLSLSVISGDREAELSFRGASNDLRNQPLLFADIGGGSTELVFGMAKGADLVADVDIRKAHSFNIGARRMMERFLHADPPSANELAQARAWAREMLGEFVEEGCKSAGQDQLRLVAVAGTATSVVAIRDRMAVYDSARVHGAHVSTAELEQVTEALMAMTLEERMRVIGLQPKRAAIIPAGLIILEALVDAAGVDGYTASESDILLGIVLDAVKTRRATTSGGIVDAFC